MKFYRDNLEIKIDAAPRVFKTREGHVVEEYISEGEKGFFVTLAESVFCAHGNTLEQAISDALWKDEINRPDMESLKQDIVANIKTRSLTLNEFRLLTGACLAGCRIALKRKKLDESPMLAHDIRAHFPEWGKVLFDVLEAE